MTWAKSAVVRLRKLRALIVFMWLLKPLAGDAASEDALHGGRPPTTIKTKLYLF